MGASERVGVEGPQQSESRDDGGSALFRQRYARVAWKSSRTVSTHREVQALEEKKGKTHAHTFRRRYQRDKDVARLVAEFDLWVIKIAALHYFTR